MEYQYDFSILRENAFDEDMVETIEAKEQEPFYYDTSRFSDTFGDLYVYRSFSDLAWTSGLESFQTGKNATFESSDSHTAVLNGVQKLRRSTGFSEFRRNTGELCNNELLRNRGSSLSPIPFSISTDGVNSLDAGLATDEYDEGLADFLHLAISSSPSISPSFQTESESDLKLNGLNRQSTIADGLGTPRNSAIQLKLVQKRKGTLEKEVEELTRNTVSLVQSTFQTSGHDSIVRRALCLASMRLEDGMQLIHAFECAQQESFQKLGIHIRELVEESSKCRWLSLHIYFKSLFLSHLLGIVQNANPVVLGSSSSTDISVAPENGNAICKQILSNKRSNLSKEAKNTLKRWFTENLDNPYPSEDIKSMLSVELSMSVAQITTWFINERGRNNKWKKRRATHDSKPHAFKRTKTEEI